AGGGEHLGGLGEVGLGEHRERVGPRPRVDAFERLAVAVALVLQPFDLAFDALVPSQFLHRFLALKFFAVRAPRPKRKLAALSRGRSSRGASRRGRTATLVICEAGAECVRYW